MFIAKALKETSNEDAPSAGEFGQSQNQNAI